jgi:hypothetical protein
VAEKALDDWGRTARLSVILIVMSVCTAGPVILIGWFLAVHGWSPEEVHRVINELLGGISGG